MRYVLKIREMKNKIKVNFLGAAGTVTGSKFLLETENLNILVDCGLFQGIKELRLLNRKPFPFPPQNIDFVLLTHGHLDHCGYLPRLVSEGFSNPILSTAPTMEIASIIMMDSGKIQEEDAKKANEEAFTVHSPATPLYTTVDAEKAIALFEIIEPEAWKTLSEDVKIRFQRNGHIIGSTFIEIDYKGKRLVFSGDIGRNFDDLLEKPRKPKRADFLFLESTYGNRLHPVENIDELLIQTVHETILNSGTLIIPSFAVERLQTVMLKLWKLYGENKIPKIPVFTDSPMGNEVLKVFEHFPQWHKLTPKDYQRMCNHFKIISSYRDTWNTLDDTRPKIVIAGSGMVTGGRVLTYLRHLIDKSESTVLLVGFQAEGTRGRQLQEGASEIKIFGHYCPVNGQIKTIHGLSAHADQKELLEWLSNIEGNPQKVFLIHGEPTASDALRVKIKDIYNWPVEIPHLNDQLLLEW